MNKKQLSERDICTKYITPALEKAGWDVTTQIREEFPLTKGRIIVRGKLHTRAKHKRADYVLFYKPSIPIAIIEAKDNNHTVGDGMQQALGYADMLQVPFVFSSNGDGFLFHNKIAADEIIERELALHDFPAVETLWQWWAQHRGLNDQQNALVTQDYFSDGSDKSPRYYQLLAINQQDHRGDSAGPESHPAGDGHRHRQDFHRLPDHLAAVEVQDEKTHPVSCRPQHPGRPDHDQRLQAVRFGHDQDPEAAGQQILRDLSFPLSGRDR